MIQTPQCACMTPSFPHDGFERQFVGVDDGGGRFAEVSVERCRRCGQRWLRYAFETEGFSRSGRWYRGAVTAAQAKRVSAASAIVVLANLPWHFYGGSYFATTGVRSEAPVDPGRL